MSIPSVFPREFVVSEIGIAPFVFRVPTGTSLPLFGRPRQPIHMYTVRAVVLPVPARGSPRRLEEMTMVE